MQMMADGNTSIASESELIAEATRKIEALLARKTKEIAGEGGEGSSGAHRLYRRAPVARRLDPKPEGVAR